MCDQQTEVLPGLYVHVPFCRGKCPYCDFYSVTDTSWVPAWLEALGREASCYRDRFACFDTLYFGGGTPSLLSGHELERLLVCLRRHFLFAADIEITIEANPDDITKEKLEHYRGLGINRVSLGVQSLRTEDLRFLQRRHTVRQTEQALEWTRACGFTNLSVDLIYGFADHTETSWLATLERALDYRPEHLSCYQMTISDETPFGRQLAEGRLAILDEERQRSFFLLTSEFLEGHGYIHYEVSNFARSASHLSRHNSKYWRHVPYLGLGPAAHSFQNGNRWWNVKSVEEYCRKLGAGQPPLAERETLTPEQLHLERLYLGLRTRDGVPVALVQGQPNADQILHALDDEGLVTRADGRILPTRDGLLVADSLPLLFCD